MKHKRPLTAGEISSSSGRTTTSSGETESQQLSDSDSETESDSVSEEYVSRCLMDKSFHSINIIKKIKTF